MFTSIQHRTIYMNWLDCLAALVHFFYWQNWPWVEKGHITTSSLCRDCKQKDVLTNYQRANKIFSFFSNWSLLSFRLLFNQKKNALLRWVPMLFSFSFFFHVRLSDLATCDRDGFHLQQKHQNWNRIERYWRFFPPPLDSFTRFRLFWLLAIMCADEKKKG